MTGQCRFKTCERDVVARGLCMAHYQQQHRGEELRGLREHRYLHKDDNGRYCTTCDEYKPWSDFYTLAQGGHKAKCKACVVSRNTEDNRARAKRG